MPCTARKSSIVLISFPPVLPMLYAMPVTPLAHGAATSAVGSNAGCASAARRFALFGNFGRDERLGPLHLVDDAVGHPVGEHEAVGPDALVARVFGRILAKYSLLSLMSSW